MSAKQEPVDDFDGYMEDFQTCLHFTPGHVLTEDDIRAVNNVINYQDISENKAVDDFANGHQAGIEEARGTTFAWIMRKIWECTANRALLHYYRLQNDMLHKAKRS